MDANSFSPTSVGSRDADPETLSKIVLARALPDGPRNHRFTRFNNVGELLARRASETPEKSFLTYYGAGGRQSVFTYAEFLFAATRMAGMMHHALGIAPGDRVATLMTNSPHTVLVYFGAWLLGATVVPVNCGEDDSRIAYILENSEAKAVFVAEEQAERCADQLRNRVSSGRHWVALGAAREGFLPFPVEFASLPWLDALPDVPPDTEALIVYTSGTTGAPKGVALDQYDLLADAHAIAEWHGFGPNDRAMCVLPIHHVNGTVVTLLTPLISGGSVVLSHRFQSSTFWRTLADEGCTWCSVVPTLLAFLCESGENVSRYDLSRFRHIICGAGPLTVELARRFHDTFGVRIVHGYGLSETTCYSCFLPVDLNEADYRHWMMECGFPSIGVPLPVNEMAIHDAQGNPLPPDARGEIVIRGHNVMRGYFRRPDANREAFAHGWFRSGDEGFYRFGKDGLAYFFITGRLKELIIRGGVNISPFDVDEILNAIPGVRAAMAVGFENDMYGEEIGAYVQLEKDAALTAEEILAQCRARLPHAKCPKVVVFGDTFPVTSTGKYQRNRLKPLFSEWRAEQFRR